MKFRLIDLFILTFLIGLVITLSMNVDILIAGCLIWSAASLVLGLLEERDPPLNALVWLIAPILLIVIWLYKIKEDRLRFGSWH